jgi:putative two-component system response regulator
MTIGDGLTEGDVRNVLQGGLQARSFDGQTLLVVEDDPAMLIALRDILEGAGYRVCTAANGRAALEVLAVEKPALILSDISMPIMDGIGLFGAVRKLPGGTAIPFVFLTARGTRDDIFAGKSLGADDYITKPVTSHELLAAVHARLQRTGELMVAQLKAAYKASLTTLANAIEARDHSTRDHVERVNAYAQAMARALVWDDARCDSLEFGAILHDIGKIAVREFILSKPGPLTREETEEMRQHPQVGGRMIEGIPYLVAAMPIVLYHHERWDGTGYSAGLKGESIPEEARLLAVVDTFDAMTSDRPYHPAYPAEQAHQEIMSQAGRQFDPEMVEAFAACWVRGKFLRILHNEI